VIATFHSCSGGVGRTFTVVETALQLARAGHRVVVWDLDLHGPGLHGIPALQALGSRVEKGTLDHLREFLDAGCRFPGTFAEDVVRWPLDFDMAGVPGRISFLFASRASGHEPGLAPGDEDRLFPKKDPPGAAFLHRVAHHLGREGGFDFVLVDTHATRGRLEAVAVLSLPDFVVLVCSPREQSVQGILSLEARLLEVAYKREVLTPGGSRTLAVMNMVPEIETEEAHASGGLRRVLEQKLDRLGMAFGPPVVLPFDPAILVSGGLPALGDDPARSPWIAVADRLGKVLADFRGARPQ
jgi:MinD-like ATPase involved in chromosome partitioning or flagellar assembly